MEYPWRETARAEYRPAQPRTGRRSRRRGASSLRQTAVDARGRPRCTANPCGCARHQRRSLKHSLQNQFRDVRRLQSAYFLSDRQRVLTDARGSIGAKLVSRKRQRRSQMPKRAEKGMPQRKETPARGKLWVEIYEIFDVLNDAGGDAGSLQLIHQDLSVEIAAPGFDRRVSRRRIRRLANVCEAPQALPIRCS